MKDERRRWRAGTLHLVLLCTGTALVRETGERRSFHFWQWGYLIGDRHSWHTGRTSDLFPEQLLSPLCACHSPLTMSIDSGPPPGPKYLPEFPLVGPPER